MTNLSESMRNKLFDLLGLQSVFPCGQSIYFNKARCLLEFSDLEKSSDHKENLEDILVSRVTSEYSLTEIIKELLNLFYSQVPVFLCSNQDNEAKTFFLSVQKRPQLISLHPGISHVYGLYQDESDIFLLQAYSKLSLLSLSRFHAQTNFFNPTLGRSSGRGARDLRLRFIIFQLLQVTSFLHSEGLCLESTGLGNIMIDEDMWLTIPFGTSTRFLQAATETTKEVISNSSDHSVLLQTQEFIERPIGYREPLISQWISGKLSNFEYLMQINAAAGRKLVDPLYHPILPWVTDFSSDFFASRSESGIRQLSLSSKKFRPSSELRRDLTKTKFRLSKGDNQLELTYRHSEPPHHVPESLSELTYYIYMARRTPMHILCRVVRDVFVPEHYPASMNRIYEWTPDECIPEFYSDPSVFESIHKHHGLHDIELPPFTSTPSDFIRYHRSVLESDEVSEMLHEWIDLTFGYRLLGQAAIDNLNVPLKQTLSNAEKIGDTSRLDKHPGFVNLFTMPHPRKRTNNSNDMFADPTTIAVEEDVEIIRQNELLDILSLDDKKSAKAKKFNPGNNNNSKGSITNSTLEDPLLIRSSSSLFLQRGSNSQTWSNAIGKQSMNTTANTKLNIEKRKSLTKLESSASSAVLSQCMDKNLSSITVSGRDLIYSYVSRTHEEAFVKEYNMLIEPCYTFSNIRASEATSSNHEMNTPSTGSTKVLWDTEFEYDYLNLRKKCEVWENKLCKSNLDRLFKARQLKSDVLKLQRDDVFSIGCLISELYSGTPLLSVQDVDQIYKLQSSSDPIRKEKATQTILRLVARRGENVPLSIRRLIALLVHMDEKVRINTQDILHASCQLDTEMDHPSSFNGSSSNYCDFFNVTINSNVEGTETFHESSSIFVGPEINMLQTYCQAIFPSYFYTTYKLIGMIKTSSNDSEKFRLLLDSIEIINNLPLEGLNLALPHFLAVVAEPCPFRLESKNHNLTTSSETDTDSIHVPPEVPASDYVWGLEKEKLVRNYSTLVDFIGSRLGQEATEKLLFPRVITFLNKLRSPEALEILLSSPLWSILCVRGGILAFLYHILPILLTYLVSGTLHAVARAEWLQTEIGSVTWNIAAISEEADWLQSSSMYALRKVQRAAVLAITGLAEPVSLGHGLCTRYVLPSLLCLIGIPQMAAAAGYGQTSLLNKASENVKLFPDRASNLDDVNLFIISEAAYNAEDMYLVRSIVSLCFQLGELVTAEVVLSKIFRIILPDLHQSFKNSSIIPPATVAALMEIILVLNEVMPSLSADTIIRFYLQSFRNHGTLSLPSLLSNIPLTVCYSVLDYNSDFSKSSNSLKPSSLEEYVNSWRMRKFHTELCRLIVSSSMMAGAQACIEYVLPNVNCFFEKFVQEYGNKVPMNSHTMSKGINLVAELYNPLSQLTGISAFKTCVPNCNSRLEMWIQHQGSSTRSQYLAELPDTILSEVILKDNSEKVKKAGILDWLTIKTPWRSNSQLVDRSHVEQENSGVSPSSAIVNKLFVSPKSEPSLKVPILPIVADLCDVNMSNVVVIADSQSSETARSSPVSARYMTAVEQGQITNPSQHEYSIEGKIGIELENLEPKLSLKKSSKATISSNSSANVVSPLTRESTPLTLLNKIGDNSIPVTKRQITSTTTDTDELQNAQDDAKADSDDDFEDYEKVEERSMDPVEDGKSQVSEEVNSQSDESETIQHAGDTVQEELPEKLIVQVDFGIASNDIYNSQSKSHFPSNNAHDEREVTRQLIVAGPIPNSDTTETSVLVIKETSPKKSLNSAVHENLRKILRPIQLGLRLPSRRNTDNSLPSPVAENGSSSDRSQSSRLLGPFSKFRNVLTNRSFQGEWIQSVRKISRRTQANTVSATNIMTSMLSRAQTEDDDDNDGLDSNQNDVIWLLAGKGRWNVTREIKEKVNQSLRGSRIEGQKYDSAGIMSITSHGQSNWTPAAHVSMTSPRITVDSSSEASSYFTLRMTNKIQFRIEDTTDGGIRAMLVDRSESLFLTSSKTGIRVYSLASHPIKLVSLYTKHTPAALHAGFLRNGLQVASCNSNSIDIWDLETRKTLATLDSNDSNSINGADVSFSHMQVVSPQTGMSPSLAAYGDDQLLACHQGSLSFYDLRLRSKNPVNAISEFTLPQPVQAVYNPFAANIVESVNITYASLVDNSVIAGSSAGTLWILDRRMGRVMSMWNGHEGSIVKICAMENQRFLTVSERSAFVWSVKPHNIYEFNDSYSSAEVNHPYNNNINQTYQYANISKVMSVRNMPESGSVPITTNTVLFHNFDQSSRLIRRANHINDYLANPAPLSVLYCFSGHKLLTEKFPKPSELSNFSMETSEEMRLNKFYFTDKHKSKLTRFHLQVSSVAMLPMRRLLLLGTEDGLVRVIS